MIICDSKGLIHFWIVCTEISMHFLIRMFYIHVFIRYLDKSEFLPRKEKKVSDLSVTLQLSKGSSVRSEF